MAPGGVILAFQKSCSAFRSFIAGRVHRNSVQFISQSEQDNNRHETNAGGRWHAIATAASFREKHSVDSGWYAATATSAWWEEYVVGCRRNAFTAVAARPEARRADSGRYATATVTTWKNKNDRTIRVKVFHFGNLE